MTHKTMAAGLAAATFSLFAQAQSYTFDNGLLDPWKRSTTGGNCITDVLSNNGSKAAHAQNTYGGSCTLSLDFSYTGTAHFGFDMQAIAVPSSPYNAIAGIKFTLLDSFNIPLGSAGLYNTTTTSWLGPKDHAIDNLQHHYAGSFADLANLAGVNPASAISKLNFAFTTHADGFAGTALANVYFDNVVVAVPEPPAAPLMALGTVMALIATRRRLSAHANPA